MLAGVMYPLKCYISLINEKKINCSTLSKSMRFDQSKYIKKIIIISLYSYSIKYIFKVRLYF